MDSENRTRPPAMTIRRYIPATNVLLERAEDLPMPPSMFLVSALIVDKRGGHDHIKLYSRGGLAGELVLEHGDGAQLASRLELVLDDSSVVDVLMNAGLGRGET